MWDLMMKNIYSLNTSSLTKQNFQLRIVYKDDATGIDNSNLIEGTNFKDIPLVKVLGLDKLNFAGDPQPDGNFDYVEDITIDSKNGKIIFPVLEPLMVLQLLMCPEVVETLIINGQMDLDLVL